MAAIVRPMDHPAPAPTGPLTRREVMIVLVTLLVVAAAALALTMAAASTITG